MAKANEVKLTVPGEEDKDLKETVKKSDELVKQTEQKNEAPAKNEEIKALEDKFEALQDLVKQALSAILKPKESELKAEEKAEAAVLGETLDGDAGTAWEEMVPVRTPRRTKGQEKSIVITVNDRNVQVPLNGKVYYLRKPHAEIFEESMMAEIAAEEFAESIPNEAAPASFEQLMSEMTELKQKLKDLGVL